MKKPCRLELNNTGAWKLMAKFDADQDQAAGAILEAARQLAEAINDPSCGRTSHTSLRISTDEACPVVLMRLNPKPGERVAWVDAMTGEPA